MPVAVATDCPPIHQLEGFLHERLPADEFETVESHVEGCVSCQDRLDGLVDSGSIESFLRRRGSSLLDRGRTDDGGPIDEATVIAGASDTTPTVIGGHRILGELGRGTFGVVYHGYDEALDRPVAIKVPRGELLEAMGGAEEYLKEARTLALLDHPHIVRVHEARADHRGSCYLVSQFVDGRSLDDHLEDRGVDADEAARIVARVADALQHAHERGIYHRDVKPANILLDRDGRPYLADFGLALTEGELGSGPRRLGTPAYTSPEQARGDGHRVDGRTDVYSLGVVLYRMLTGKRPFMAKRVRELLDLIVNVDPPSARQRNRGIPVDLDRICSRALARDPADRYQTAGDLADELDQWLRTRSKVCDSAPISGSTEPSATMPQMPAPERRVVTRRRVLSGLIAASAAAAAIPVSRMFNIGARSAVGRLKIGMKPWIGYAPLVVARELDLCEGLEIVFEPVTTTTGASRELLTGKLDLSGYLVDTHVLARANKVPTKVVQMLDESGTADAVVARPGIETFGDLRDRSVAYVHHEAPHYLLLALCEKHGIALDEMRHEKTASPAEAVELFVDGRVEAVVAYDPFLEQGQRRVPGSRRIASGADVPGAIVDLLVAREELVNEHPETIRSLIAGSMRGLELLRQRDERAMEIACRFLGTDDEPITVRDYEIMEQGMTYSGVEENVAFFTRNEHGLSDFHRRVAAAEDRLDRHHQLPVRTDPRAGDGSSILLGMYGQS